MTGRHERCEVCGVGRVMVLFVDGLPGGEHARVMTGEEITSCSNRDCPSHAPTGPIPVVTNHDRAIAEIRSIKLELRERMDRGEWA